MGMMRVGKPEGKKPFGIPGFRWKDNIKIHLTFVEYEVLTGFIWLRFRTSGELL
jgi:hypothetical protein